jgi:hypothetical protein
LARLIWQEHSGYVANVSLALRFGVRYKDVLSRTAQARYDWTSIGRKLAHELDGLASLRQRSTPVA